VQKIYYILFGLLELEMADLGSIKNKSLSPLGIKVAFRFSCDKKELVIVYN
jgi:hypothetical protein